MRVVEIERQDGQRRYVVIDEDGVLVEPIVRYLKYLDCVGSARETLRSYAYSLKHYWEYLTQKQLDWHHCSCPEAQRAEAEKCRGGHCCSPAGAKVCQLSHRCEEGSGE